MNNNNQQIRMTTAQFLARERIVLTGKSTDSPIMVLSSGGLAVASDSDVEVNSPAKAPQTAGVDDNAAAAVSQQASKGKPSTRSQRQAKPPAAKPIAIDMDVEVLEVDQESAEMPPAKLRAVENLSLPKRARMPSNSAKGEARRRKNEGSEARQPRKRQTSRSAASQGTAQPPAPARAEEPGAATAEEPGAATAEDAGAVKAEQAGPSEPPRRQQRAAAPAAASAAAGDAKLPKKTARKTAGATQKAPSVKVKKEAAAAATAGSSGVIEKVLPQAELDAALAGLKRAEPHHELKHEPGEALPAYMHASTHDAWQLSCTCRASFRKGELLRYEIHLFKCREGALSQLWDPSEREALCVSRRGPDGESLPEEVLGGGSEGGTLWHVLKTQRDISEVWSACAHFR